MISWDWFIWTASLKRFLKVIKRKIYPTPQVLVYSTPMTKLTLVWKGSIQKKLCWEYISSYFSAYKEPIRVLTIVAWHDCHTGIVVDKTLLLGSRL